MQCPPKTMPPSRSSSSLLACRALLSSSGRFSSLNIARLPSRTKLLSELTAVQDRQRHKNAGMNQLYCCMFFMDSAGFQEMYVATEDNWQSRIVTTSFCSILTPGFTALSSKTVVHMVCGPAFWQACVIYFEHMRDLAGTLSATLTTLHA